jgi:hypothetical protein
MTDGMYHRSLRVSLVVVAFVLLFDGGFVSPVTKVFSENTYMYLANAVGVFAGVQPNELNILTTQITERTQELDARERALKEREIAARDFGTTESDYSVYILSLILFILTILIITNYFLDWRRSRMTLA